MSVVDLHPEDLLEKEALGALGETERVRLDAHLAHCSVCRFERQLRADFAGELEDETPLERIAALGSLGALAVETIAVVPAAAESRALLRRPRRQRAKAVWLLAAAALLVGGAAAAMNGLAEGPWSRFAVRPAPAAPADLGTAQPPRGNAHPAFRPSEPVVPDEAAETVEPTAPSPRAASVGLSARSTSFAVAAPVKVVGPAELFDAATDARRRGDYGRVLELDRELESRFPTSREAQTVRVTVGRLLLDRADPAGALAKFEAYLAAGGGALGEDAMVGRATALDRLGRSDDAVRAWTTLLASFPESPYAAHARSRIETPNGR